MTAHPSSRPRPRLRELDALRGIGALAVLLFHYTTRFPEMFPGASHVGIRIAGGHYSVLLFFALSGFAIFFSLEKLTRVSDFAAARFARLFPAYWAAMAVTLAVQAVAQVPLFSVSTTALVVNPTMLQPFFRLPSIDGAYWTLAVELAFYACMALVWRMGWLHRIERVLLGWLALKWLLWLWPDMPEAAVMLLDLRYIHFFAIGLVAYRVSAGHRTWAQQLPLIVAIFVTIARVETGDVFAVAALLLLVFHQVVAGRMHWLCVRPLLWLGTMSYPLYLVHQHVGMTIMLRTGEAGWYPWIGFALAVAAALTLAGIIHRIIERPAGDAILARWRDWRAAHAASAASVAPERRRLTELDALRGLGALLVVNFHYSTRFHEMFPRAGHVPFHIFGGDYRVLLFFAISGFAIFFTMDGLKSVSDFVFGRFARLFPAYWAAMSLTLIAEHYGHVPALDISPLALAVNVTMLQAFFFLPAVDGAYWTLAVELGFYASMIVLWRIGRLRQIERILLVWLALKVLMFVWPDMPERIVMLLVLRYIPFFAIGMLSYRAWKGQRSWMQQAPYFVAVVATVAFTGTPDMLIAAIVLILCFRMMIGGALRWLCLRPLIWVGGISYSLYLVHQHIGFIIMLNGDRLGIDPWLSYVAAVATAFALGALINRFIERPAARWLLARWKERRGVSLRPREANFATPHERNG